MLSLSVLLVALSSAIVSVSAHGYVQEVHIDGQVYSGWLPWNDPWASPVPTRIVRKVPGDGPQLDVSSKHMACNEGGEVGTNKVADINAGGKISFLWNTWPEDHHGPVTTYMASCSGKCSSFNTADAKWFKIDEAGYKNGKWASDQLIAQNNSWTSTIPSGIPSGEYLVRTEIVALHTAGQPQFYPSCSQVNVKNGGSGKLSNTELVAIPGIYKDTKWPDIWSDSFNKFTVPGPKLVSFGGSGDSPAPVPSNSSSKPSSSISHSSSTKSPAPSNTDAPPPSCAGDRSKRSKRSNPIGSQRRSRLHKSSHRRSH